MCGHPQTLESGPHTLELQCVVSQRLWLQCLAGQRLEATHWTSSVWNPQTLVLQSSCDRSQSVALDVVACPHSTLSPSPAGLTLSPLTSSRRHHHRSRSPRHSPSPRLRIAPSPRTRTPSTQIPIHTFSWALLAPPARRCPPLCGPACLQIYKHSLSPPLRPPSVPDPPSRSAAVAAPPQELAPSRRVNSRKHAPTLPRPDARGRSIKMLMA